MSFDDWVRASTGAVGYGELRLRDCYETVGKKRVIRKEKVDFSSAANEIQAAQLVAPYEVDGWRCIDVGFSNRHRRVKGMVYEVTLMRYEEIAQEDPELPR